MSLARTAAQRTPNPLFSFLTDHGCLEPYIRSGYVHLIPDPGDFNPLFGTSALQMAEERTAGWKPDQKSMGLLNALAEDDHHRLLRQLPENSLRQWFRKHMSQASDTEIESAITYMKAELAADPYALLQPTEPGETGAPFLYFKGYSLEAAMYLASLTGSAIYTDIEAHWQQLHLHAVQTGRAVAGSWTPVVDSLRAIDFPIDMNAQTLYEVRQSGRFGGMRAAMRRLAEASRQSSDQPQQDQIAIQFTAAAKAVKSQWANVPHTLRLMGSVELYVPAGGFERNDVRRLLLTFGKTKTTHFIPLAMLIKLEAADTTIT